MNTANGTSMTGPDRLQIVTDLWRSVVPLVVPNPYQLRLWLNIQDLGPAMTSESVL